VKPDAYPLTRLGYLSDKVRRRMFARAMQELQHAQKRSTETIEKLAFTVNLVSGTGIKSLFCLKIKLFCFSNNGNQNYASG